MRRPRAEGLGPSSSARAHLGPGQAAPLGFHFSPYMRRGRPGFPFQRDLGRPAATGNDRQGARGPELRSQPGCAGCRAHSAHNSLTRPALPQGSSPSPPAHHIFRGSPQGPHSPLGLGCLPLTSSTRISQRKSLRHKSPWRELGLVPGRLRARLGFLQPWPPSPAPPPGAPLPGAAPWDSCRFQAQARLSPHWETMTLCPAPAAGPPCLPLLTPLAPTFQNKKKSPAPGTGI